MSRVLRPGGSFVCMSYGVPKDREPYLRHESQHFPWDVSVKCCKKPNLRDVKVSLPRRRGSRLRRREPVRGGPREVPAPCARRKWKAITCNGLVRPSFVCSTQGM